MSVSEEKPQNNGFAADLTDGRKPGDWKTRYDDPIAIAAIKWEKNYLIIVLVVFLCLPLISGIYIKQYLLPSEYICAKKYLFGWLGGTLGGILFAMKWLYHGVAKHNWNIDRRIWRIFTPHLSGALALTITVLICAGVLSSGQDSYSYHKAYGIGFLVGYFSDNALGKLTEVANVLFASSSKK